MSGTAEETVNKLFIVHQEAIYRHGLVGVFDDKDKAISASIDAAKADIDSHHYYVVRPATLGVAGSMNSLFPETDGVDSGLARYPIEEEPVFIANKSDLEKNFLGDKEAMSFLGL